MGNDHDPKTKFQPESMTKAIRKLLDAEEAIKNFTKKMTIVFSDVSGYTKYMDTHGDIKGRAWIQKHHDIVFPLIEKHGGSILDVMGDGLMVSFQETLPAVKASGWIVPSNKNVAFGHGERTTRQSGCSDRAAGTDSVRRRCKGIPSTGRRSLHLFAVNEKMAFLRHIYTLPRRS